MGLIDVCTKKIVFLFKISSYNKMCICIFMVFNKNLYIYNETFHLLRLSSWTIIYLYFAQSAGTIEYTDCTSTEE